MKKIVLGMAALSLIVVFGCAGKSKSKPKTAKLKGGFERVHFDFDSADIKPEYKSVLKNNAKLLKEGDTSKVVIEGHCDERGSDEYNTALGYRRANSAKDYLVSLGVAASNLQTKSYGEDRPLEKCHEEGCWQKNRRADFVAK